jgi:hypothetical protein
MGYAKFQKACGQLFLLAFYYHKQAISIKKLEIMLIKKEK